MVGRIRFMKRPASNEQVFTLLGNTVASWFRKKFGSFTLSQRYAIPAIKARKSILVSSPTGSGKTLCAFTAILDYLIELSKRNELEDKVYCVYVSPLRALSRDIEVNLKGPLAEMQEQEGKEFGIRIAVRTGDTTQSERAAMLKKPPHILITTPETLAILLTTKRFREFLRAVEFCIVDEIHAMANKRGTHLSLSLERLQHISVMPITRIGLSATVAPLELVARFLVGYEKTAKGWQERECWIADVGFEKKIDVSVLTPTESLIYVHAEELSDKLYELIDKLVQEHRTTLIFTNTRSATERVVHHLKERFPSKYVENIGAHHSSLSRHSRLSIEQRLRNGELRVVVTSTSLELGIDIGYIDLVILLGSPKSVARAMQRIGRAGHKLHETAKGRFIVLDQDDLVECSVMQKAIKEKKIDKIDFPRNCLDVLAQHIYGMAIEQRWNVDELYNLVRQSYCYHELNREDFFAVISYLAGEYALEARDVYAKIWYDSETREIGRRGKLARMIYMTNIGTIPDESYVNVVIAGGERKGVKVGVIDEGFLERLRPGDVFVLGGERYEFLYTRGMNAYVKASVYRPPTIPSWFSEILPLSFDLACEIQRFRRLMAEKFTRGMSAEEIKGFIKKHLHVDDKIANAIYQYFYDQHAYIGIPHERLMLIEHYKAEKNFLVFHSLYGRRVNDALSRAYAYVIAQAGGRDVQIGINDNGFFIGGEKLHAEKALKFVTSENIDEILKEAIDRTEILKRRFRHCATRGLMILRSYKGKTKSVGRQQMKSEMLMHAVRKISQEFPILKEARREVMEDVMDVANAKKVLDWLHSKKIRVKHVNVKVPSPFALNLIMQGYADLIKIEDKLEFLKRMYDAIKKMQK